MPTIEHNRNTVVLDQSSDTEVDVNVTNDGFDANITNDSLSVDIESEPASTVAQALTDSNKLAAILCELIKIRLILQEISEVEVTDADLNGSKVS